MENSLGRLWLLNKPQSKLKDKMTFYIETDEKEKDFLKVDSPEELTVCDPAVGSGHLLAYAFDLLYEIYEEEGYLPSEIPRLILEKNLYGMEIDERAGSLAALALCMKARAKDRRFFKRDVRPNICVLQSVGLTDAELYELPWFSSLEAVEQVALTVDLKAFSAERKEDALIKNVGSLYRPRMTMEQVVQVRSKMEEKADLFANKQSEAADQILDQLELLAKKYHVVIANPPYMGSKGMNQTLKEFAKASYPASKPDLFAMFMEKGMDMLYPAGMSAMITMQSWMFLSAFEALRKEPHTTRDHRLNGTPRPACI